MSKATKRERQKENRERAREERERLLKRDRRMKSARNLLILLAPVVLIAVIVSATGGDDGRAFSKSKFYTATIETSEGNIDVALDAKTAPIATKHFIELVDKKYYDGLCIDRLAKDFVIQGGSPKCDALGGTGTSVNGETPTDHYPIGTLAAAKGGADPAGTFDAQFFVVTGSQGATLPNDYARFGTVISGLDVAQKIEKMPAVGGAKDGKPVKKITIKKITIKESKTATSTSSTAPASSSSTTSTTAPAASSSTTTKP